MSRGHGWSPYSPEERILHDASAAYMSHPLLEVISLYMNDKITGELLGTIVGRMEYHPSDIYWKDIWDLICCLRGHTVYPPPTFSAEEDEALKGKLLKGLMSGLLHAEQDQAMGPGIEGIRYL